MSIILYVHDVFHFLNNKDCFHNVHGGCVTSVMQDICDASDFLHNYDDNLDYDLCNAVLGIKINKDPYNLSYTFKSKLMAPDQYPSSMYLP
jgi:hypothetical protein